MPLICLIDLITRLRSKKISKENVWSKKKIFKRNLGQKKIWIEKISVQKNFVSKNFCVQIILGRKKVWVQICFMSFKSKIKVEFDTVRQSLVSIFLLEMIYML